MSHEHRLRPARQGDPPTWGDRVLVAISGLDGSGKTTLAKAVVARIAAAGETAARLKIGDLRSWSLLEQLGRQSKPYADYAFDADRISVALNLERFALLSDQLAAYASAARFLVIDRFTLDWAAVGRAFGSGEHELFLLRGLERLLPLRVEPFLLDVAPALADERIRLRGRTGELREGLPYLTNVDNAYRFLLASGEYRPTVLDGTLQPAQLAELVVDRLEQRGLFGSEGVERDRVDWSPSSFGQ